MKKYLVVGLTLIGLVSISAFAQSDRGPKPPDAGEGKGGGGSGGGGHQLSAPNRLATKFDNGPRGGNFAARGGLESQTLKQLAATRAGSGSGASNWDNGDVKGNNGTGSGRKEPKAMKQLVSARGDNEARSGGKDDTGGGNGNNGTGGGGRQSSGK